jgi:hypothetical protein
VPFAPFALLFFPNLKQARLSLLLVLLLALLRTVPALSQGQQLPPDTVPVTARMLDQVQLDQFRNNSDFQYGQDGTLPANPLARLWHRFWQKVGQMLQETSYYGFWRYVFILFFAVAAVFVILRLLKIDVAGLFRSKGHPLPVSYQTLQENIHEMDFEGMIARAAEEQNYRLAIRLHYLRTLKTLTDRDLIRWQPDRTNRSYLTDIQAPLVRQGFEKITTLFEYAWYGHFEIDAPHFERTTSAFGTFHHLLNSTARP